MEMTPRLGLPLLVPGQVQKEIFHNEALLLVDLLLCGSIDGGPIAAPPSAPTDGALYRVAASGASGAFAGHEQQLAGWTEAGWRFVSPFEGMRLTDRSSGLAIVYQSGSWSNGEDQTSKVMIEEKQVVGPRRPAVSAPAGGSNVDAEARNAILAILSTLRIHGLIEA